MSKSPLDTAKDVMSGKVTKDRIVRAEQAGVRAIPNRPIAAIITTPFTFLLRAFILCSLSL